MKPDPAFWKRFGSVAGAVLYFPAAAMLFFRGALLGEYHVPYDLAEFHHPLAELIGWSLREFGRLPWWNPFSYMGEPFYANVQAAMFYPPTLLTVLAGNAFQGRVTYWALEMQLIAHVVVAGWGAYVLLRLLGVTAAAALAGATIYQLGGFFASQTQHLGAVNAAAWLPWFLAALHRLEQQRNLRSAAVCGMALALMVLPGFPPAYLPALVFGPLLYGYWMWQRYPAPDWRAHGRAAAMLALAVLLALLLASISLVPGFYLGKRSIATWRPLEQALEGLTVEAATSFVWPNLFNQLRGEFWFPKENPTFMHVYHGIPAVLLVLTGLGWLARSPRARPYMVAAILALLWMFGKTFIVAQFFYLAFPGFLGRGIYPQFVLAYFSLFFAVLAALALDSYERGERRSLFRGRLCWQAAALAALAALLLTASGAFAPAASVVGARAAAAGAGLFLVVLSLGLCGLLVRTYGAADPPSRRRLSFALCALILFDLLAVGSHTRLNSSQEDPEEVPPAAQFLQQRLGADALYRMDTSETGYTWQARVPGWRLPSANGSNPLLLRDVYVYRAPFSRTDNREFSLELPESPLLDLAGIRYIVTPREKVAGAKLIHQGHMNVFENPRAFPRFFLVGGVVGARDVGDAVRIIHTREADASRVAVVLDADLGRFPGLAGPAASAELGEVQLLAYTPNEIRLRVHAARPAVLVAIESWWPEWRAEVAGAPQPLVRADGAFRAVGVPAGACEVRMFLVPGQLYLGAAFSGLGVLLTAGCLLWPRSGTASAPG